MSSRADAWPRPRMKLLVQQIRNARLNAYLLVKHCGQAAHEFPHVHDHTHRWRGCLCTHAASQARERILQRTPIAVHLRVRNRDYECFSRALAWSSCTHHTWLACAKRATRHLQECPACWAGKACIIHSQCLMDWQNFLLDIVIKRRIALASCSNWQDYAAACASPHEKREKGITWPTNF